MIQFKAGRIAGIVLLSLALSAPAFAIDSGGGDDNPPPPAPTQPSHPPKPSNDGGTNQSKPTPTLAAARAEIKAKHWDNAIGMLKLIVKAKPGADAYNLLGYSYRNAGNYDLAGKAYARALKIDPNHTGALEYQGILFIKLGQTDKAKANLAKIKSICGTSCEEYEDLNKALS